MIQAIEITNYRNEHIRLELSDPYEIGMAVIDIDGLGPVDCDVNITEYESLIDGALFNSARATSRNIVLSLQFLDYYRSIEEVRHDTYKYFPLKKRLKFLVETDTRVCEIYGWVESNVPSIFDRAEGCQISIICPRPWFYDSVRDTQITLKTITDGFKFPFKNNIHPVNEFKFRWANNSLSNNMLQFYDSECENYIKFGEIEHSKERILYYNGEVETGVEIRMLSNGVIRNPIIKNGKTNEFMRINTDMMTNLTGSGFTNGDEIIIQTEKGSKSITLVRGGDMINILNCLSPNTDWIQVVQGDNPFSYTSDYGEDDLEIIVTAKIAYEGA